MVEPPLPVAYPRDPLAGNGLVLKRHQFKLVGSRYSIFSASGALVYVADRGLKLKEEIKVFADEQLQRQVMAIHARQILDVSAAYDVTDTTTGQRVGTLKRKGLNSMVRDEWIIMDPYENEIGIVIEDSLFMALLRRLLSNLIPQNYDAIVQGRKVVDLRQNFNPFSYHLAIDFLVPPQDFDRRLGVAMAVLLAAIEGRQSG